MATLSELIKEKNTLPLGNVYFKTINGKEYTYYQYFKDGKRYTKIVKKEDVPELIAKVVRRKEIEALIKEYKRKDKDVVLSPSMNNLTGYVMSGNNVVAEFNNGELVNINKKLAPLSIVRTHSLQAFLSLRVIDMSRTNARLLKKSLNIQSDEDYKISLYAYALSISDNYWFKPKHSKIKYVDLSLNTDIYSDVALKGDLTVFPHKAKLTPEITTTGSFEKGWKMIGDEWYLYKSGNAKQIFSELFCSEFAKLIGIPTATYEYDGEYIRSKNFADKYNFEPIAALAGDNEDYNYIFHILNKINPEIAKQYIKLIFFDSVVNNVDRHNENLGILRDRKTGKIVSLAPNFDNNLALISTVDSLPLPNKDGLIKIFVSFINKNELARKLFEEMFYPEITIKQIQTIADSIAINIKNKDDICESIYRRYNYLKTSF